MSRVCQVCGRGPKSSQSRSHSNIATKRTQNINLQVAAIKGKRTRVCANCLKSIAKKRNA
ncbi:50S ribosomal protein L28 [Patescibacteria group bacterium]|nr:50S ribosomal protein L28 [Patescibacteria group bacterium]MBU4368780.1 50S ribosomal protein L28 [Patescibacteria group bacterium]